jgi:hypothetical protein
MTMAVKKTVQRPVEPEPKPKPRPLPEPEPNDDDDLVKSVESVVALLRGLESVLIGSSPDQETVRKLYANLRGPNTKEES